MNKKLFEILTPPSLRIFEITSIYSTMLCAVSRKKQVTIASQVPAYTVTDRIRIRKASYKSDL